MVSDICSSEIVALDSKLPVNATVPTSCVFAVTFAVAESLPVTLKYANVAPTTYSS